MGNKYSYLVEGKNLLALIPIRKSGQAYFAFSYCKESINTNREYSLVNARLAKVSNAKKWHAVYRRVEGLYCADEMNPSEFFLSDYSPL